MNTDAMTWIDDVLNTKTRYGMVDSSIDATIRYLIAEQYDAESIELDVFNVDSNMLKLRSTDDTTNSLDLFDTYLFEKTLDHKLDAQGWKYWHWDYFKYNSAEYAAKWTQKTGSPAQLENPGYKLIEWCIHQR